MSLVCFLSRFTISLAERCRWCRGFALWVRIRRLPNSRRKYLMPFGVFRREYTMTCCFVGNSTLWCDVLSQNSGQQLAFMFLPKTSTGRFRCLKLRCGSGVLRRRVIDPTYPSVQKLESVPINNAIRILYRNWWYLCRHQDIPSQTLYLMPAYIYLYQSSSKPHPSSFASSSPQSSNPGQAPVSASSSRLFLCSSSTICSTTLFLLFTGNLIPEPCAFAGDVVFCWFLGFVQASSSSSRSFHASTSPCVPNPRSSGGVSNFVGRDCVGGTGSGRRSPFASVPNTLLLRPAIAQPARAEPADSAKLSLDDGWFGVIERGVSVATGSAVSGIDAVSLVIRARKVSIVFVAWTRTIL
jgi:hypothetical protein